MWEAKWQKTGDINNPKIPVKFARANGELLFREEPQLGPPAAPVNPKLVAEAESGEE